MIMMTMMALQKFNLRTIKAILHLISIWLAPLMMIFDQPCWQNISLFRLKSSTYGTFHQDISNIRLTACIHLSFQQTNKIGGNSSLLTLIQCDIKLICVIKFVLKFCFLIKNLILIKVKRKTALVFLRCFMFLSHSTLVTSSRS